MTQLGLIKMEMQKSKGKHTQPPNDGNIVMESQDFTLTLSLT